MPFYKIAKEADRIKIFFEDIPSHSTRKKLKANGWRWDPNEQCWWNFYNQTNRDFAASMYPPTVDSQSNKTQQKTEIIEKGACGPTAMWMLSFLGQLLIGGSGEITGYDYDQIEKSPWFHTRQRIKYIKVQNGITSIGKRAFYDFPELLEVELPDSVTAIGDRAFSKCKKLRSIRMPQKLKTIGVQAFRDCISLPEIHLPETISDIGEDCFKNWEDKQVIFLAKKDTRTGKVVENACSPIRNSISLTPKIHFEDFVTVTTNNYCVANNHFYENVQAQVDILRRDGTLKTVAIPAGYCRTCKKYTIGLWQFEELRKMGVILCRMIHESSTHSSQNNTFYSELSPESLLKQSGYSVNSADDLTDEQRRQILICLMESGICSKQKITSHLSWLIQSREGQAYMVNAIYKWKMDRQFVDAYKIGSGRVVALRSLKVRR